MSPAIEESPIVIEESFHENQIVFDMIYNPTETKLLTLAKKKGAKVLGGLAMLVHQAAKSFELWTGESMPIEKISNSLELMIKNN